MLLTLLGRTRREDRYHTRRLAGIENECNFLDPDTFREGGYDIDPGDNGNAFSLHPANDDALFHWIDIIRYQRLRVGDLSRGEIEIEPMELN